MSLEIFHFRWSHLDGAPKTHEYIIPRVFPSFKPQVISVESSFTRITSLSPWARFTRNARQEKTRKLALTRDTNPSRCRTSLGKILFISSSRRQLNDRNSSAEPLSPFFRHFIPSFALRISNSLDPRGGISILLGDNSEIVPDSSSRRAKPLWEETRELPSFRLTFHGTILARACGKVRSRV